MLERAAAAPAGQAALPLVSSAGAPLKQTLLALRGSVQLADQDAPGPATLQVLQGRARLVTSEGSWELSPGDHLQLLPSRHRLESLEDAAVLLTMAVTIQLRETPGNLSGSGSGTHQHFLQPMPIVATRCY